MCYRLLLSAAQCVAQGYWVPPMFWTCLVGGSNPGVCTVLFNKHWVQSLCCLWVSSVPGMWVAVTSYSVTALMQTSFCFRQTQQPCATLTVNSSEYISEMNCIKGNAYRCLETTAKFSTETASTRLIALCKKKSLRLHLEINYLW